MPKVEYYIQHIINRWSCNKEISNRLCLFFQTPFSFWLYSNGFLWDASYIDGRYTKLL